ncbi:Long-chain-fatty-acid--CoA ligase [Cystobacter fuscus DSM 2262]|uniref:Long-chain-fatty-acid--CoA ligase n=1 Tax=Cystobacter fuscus (strain ATCC 25194 / DSM 2262 / NBRC 100088 / M29) TaxID=1242864 RepID=S9QL87_CYSF2|nr:non-ribosomal peptide synthetase [Cystobacter fuscus]EPX57243.1 Long-chain-fatty-acid--CoA ligase [Cystobacter fuscus DSM 2262]
MSELNRKKLLEKMMQQRRASKQAAPGALLPRSGSSSPLPLSFAQQRLWFLEQLEPGNTAYNVPAAVRLTGELDVRALEKALHGVVRRHEALRTTFDAHEGKPFQVIHPELLVPLPLSDWSGWGREEQERALREARREESARPFDLVRGPLVRARLLRLGERVHVLLYTLHHIISDGWSVGVLVREMAALYQEQRTGRPAQLAPLPVQYADYALWQQSQLSGQALEEALAHWTKRLAGAPRVLELPTDRKRPAVQTHRGARQEVRLSAELTQALQGVCRQQGATLFMGLLAVFQLLLSRYARQEDVVVGTPTAHRPRMETEGLIGFFVNTLVLRTDLSGAPSFRGLLERVKEVALDAFSHQDVPFEKLVERLQPERDTSVSPLFQVMFALQNTPEGQLQVEGLTLREVEGSESQTAQFDLTLALTEVNGALQGAFEFNTDLFEQESIARMARHFQALLKAAVQQPDKSITALPLVDEQQRREILEGWNGTERELPRAPFIHEWVMQQAEHTPDKPAVMFEEQSLTFRELRAGVRRVAAALQARGVGPEVTVGLVVERSVEAVVGLLGVLEAGGSYVPMDPAAPQERLAYMMGDSQTRLLLTQHRLKPRLSFFAGEVLCLDVPEDFPEADFTPPVLHGHSSAYVIYTSGSTGQPKGVQVSHANVLNSTFARRHSYPMAPECYLMLSPFTFDSSVCGIFWTLANGGTLVLPPDALRESASEIPRLIERHRATHLSFTPSLYSAVLELATPEQLRSLRLIIVGSEASPPALLERHARLAPQALLFNEYGPTESTVWSTRHPCVPDPKATTVPIGSPPSNMRAYILDRHLQLVPPGIPGELYIAGDNLARGYLRKPGLTAERFLPDPFARQPGARMYRTGDLARWRTDGVIEFHGRVDHQVKIRGFRIELGEIEEVLTGHPGLVETVVLAREDRPGDKQLVAYVVPAAQPGASAEELRAFLRTKLPEYMVPAFFVTLEALPLTSNGKVDWRALPAPEAGSSESYVAPRDELEEKLTSIWAQLLHLERVGVRDRFFELGGHSLLATQLHTRIRQTFGVELPLRALFESSTVETQAQRVAAVLPSARAALSPILSASREGMLPLSFAQQRLWFLEQLEPGNTAYNMPAAVRLTGELDAAALEKALHGVVRRHEALRTTFDSLEGKPFQVIHPELLVPLPLSDWSGLSAEDKEQALRTARREEASRPFDLMRGPLVRARLLRLGEREHVLLYTLHHIISDGWSVGVLVREMAALYQEQRTGHPAQLAPLPVQYADYALWQQSQLSGQALEEALAHWTKRLAGAPRVLELPTDRKRPAVQTHRGARQDIRLSAELTQELQGVCRQQGATLFMGLLAVFQLLLSRYARQEDVVVGTPTAHRPRMETEGLIGFFVNTLVLRTDLSGAPSFRGLLERVKEVALDAFSHQDVPFEKLVERLQPERDTSVSPLFQVMFALQNTPEEQLQVEGLTLREVEGSESQTAQFDLTLALTEVDGALQGSFEFNTDLFEQESIARMARHFQALLQAAVKQPERPITALPLVDEQEQREILEGWNATERELPRAPFIHEWVMQQAERTPDKPAVVFEEQSLTFRELRAGARRVAAALQARGVGPEVTVGLVVERSVEGVVGLLGVLEAGGSYVPMDPALPQERLAYMMGDSQTRLLLTQRALKPRLSFFAGEVLCLDVPEDFPEADFTSPALDGRHGAYVIYTSGSTGQPKGVQVSHASVLNSTFARHIAFPTRPESYLMLAPFSFDPSVCGIFWTLINGGTLVLPPDALRESASEIPRLIERHRISHLSFTPSLYSAVLELASPEQLRSLRLIIVASEASPPALLERHARVVPQALLFNEYGPTESTVWCTVHPCVPDPKATTVPIGRPISNMRAYILDRHLQLVPPGVPGELYISGDNLARGYLRKPGLTAERFLPDPFARQPGARMYRTGDLARWRTDGVIEFNGRVDHQVKIRGFRIELGEIEEVLTGHPALVETVVLAREDRPGDKQLVAYVVPAARPGPSVEEMRAFLRTKLPEYMVPTFFVTLEALPLTANGKVDWRVLPPPEAPRRQEQVAPRNEREAAVARVFAEVLGLPRVGVTETFFELGGHSLSAVRVFAALRDTLGIQLPLKAIFEAPTVEALARRIERPVSPKGGALVTLREGGHKAPFFAVHPIGGSVFCYAELARSLDPQRPFLALQARGLEGEAPPRERIEEMAAAYVEEIRRVRPLGPYLLGGWSLGGVVAFEMAQQFLRAGEPVALVLIDSYLSSTPSEEASSAELLTGFLQDVTALEGRSVDAWAPGDVSRVEELAPVLEAVGVDAQRGRSLFEVFRAHARALDQYVARPYPGTLFLLRSTDDPDAAMEETWKRLAQGEVRASTLETHHYGLLRAPHVQRLAAWLRACLDEAEQEAGVARSSGRAAGA